LYERLLNKNEVPDETMIAEHMGRSSNERLDALECTLKKNYQLSKELKFPFGSDYGWGYKYGHRSSHLCYVFFERGSFTVTLQIGDKLVPLAESILPSLLPKTRELWEKRYPCGERGGWVHYRVLTDEELDDVVKLIAVRKRPSA